MSNDNLIKKSSENIEQQEGQMKMDKAEGFKNDENMTKSTAAEGVLLAPSEDVHTIKKMDSVVHADEEQDLDELSHSSLVMNPSGNENGEELDLDELAHNSMGSLSSSDEIDVDDLIHQSPPSAANNADGSTGSE